MFPEDKGEEDVRATVHGWKLTRAGEEMSGGSGGDRGFGRD